MKIKENLAIAFLAILALYGGYVLYFPTPTQSGIVADLRTQAIHQYGDYRGPLSSISRTFVDPSAVAGIIENYIKSGMESDAALSFLQRQQFVIKSISHDKESDTIKITAGRTTGGGYMYNLRIEIILYIQQDTVVSSTGTVALIATGL